MSQQCVQTVKHDTEDNMLLPSKSSYDTTKSQASEKNSFGMAAIPVDLFGIRSFLFMYTRRLVFNGSVCL